MFLCKSNAASDCGTYGNNLNLDKSHKQGLELQNKYVFSPKWSTDLNYAYTDAKIDSDDKGAGSLNGKTNPMTSKHNISASVIYSFNDNANMMLTQKYRSDAFAEEDYANIFTKKQMACAVLSVVSVNLALATASSTRSSTGTSKGCL